MIEHQAKWSDLLKESVKEPGLILRAYTSFHGYSLGNQVAALVQCVRRGIQPGPINTYEGWKKLNRQVRKGEKGLWLCMPLIKKSKNDEGNEVEFVTSFAWKPHWFAISQTVGEEYEMPLIPGWDKARALECLTVTEVRFIHLDGNCLGFARGKEIAVSPICPLPWKTLFHELAHVELGHTAEADFSDSERTPKSLKEVEAEAVALLLCESLLLPGAKYARGYIQNWLEGEVIPDKSAQKIFGAADRILRAGRQQ